MSDKRHICSEEKRKAIAASFAATLAKRSRQIPKCFDIKIDLSHLSAKQTNQLKMLFLEGKWLYNSLIARMDKDESFDIFKHNVLKDKTVTRLDKDRNEIEQPLDYLGSSQKVNIVKRIRTSIKTLASLKKNGHNVGKLGFVSEFNSIPLPQYGVTHSIKSNGRVKVQGVHGTLRVRGLGQFIDLPIEKDISSWNLVRKADGYHIRMSVYFDKDQWYNRENHHWKPLDEDIGIDFGCSSSLTLSDGRKFNPRVGESERLKRLQRKLQKRPNKRSNGSWKLKRLIRREYQRMTNRKNDLANKFVASLKPYRRVVIQYERLAAWQADGHGKSVAHSVLGRVKTKVKALPNARVLDAFIPTTKLCTKCGAMRREMSLHDRTFVCGCNGNVAEDRDVHAAKNMVEIYLMVKDFMGADSRTLGAERTEVKREDFLNAYRSRFQRDYGAAEGGIAKPPRL